MSLSRSDAQTPNTSASASAAANTFTTELAPEYRARREGLQGAFPAAHGFLFALEHLCPRGSRFHLGTTKNLHLYLGDRFLCYIKIERPAALLLSPAPNVNLKVGTRPDPGSLFPRPIEKLVEQHKGFRARWAVRTEDKFRVMPGAPEAFFTDLLNLISALS